MNIEEKIELFEKHLKGEERAENTVLKYLRDVKMFYNWLVNENVLVEEMSSEGNLTKEILISYKEYLKESKLRVSSINSKISSLNAFFKYTGDENLKIKLIKCQKSLFESEGRELTKDDYRKLHGACKNESRLKLIIETIACTGIRVSELKYITRDSLKLGKAIVNNKGKIRVVLLPRKLCIKLIDYCRSSEICETTSVGADIIRPVVGATHCEPVFVTRNGTPIDRKQIWQMLKNLADKAGVSKEKVFPHNLRHLFAREFYNATHDIVKLASLLGHSSIETTRVYTKETEDECRSTLERIEILIE